jgi:hypothetical protein
MTSISDIISAVKVEQARIKESLAQGNLPNFETYQRLVGQYQGLEATLEIINNLLKEEDNDR